jgi:hypothetical protein
MESKGTPEILLALGAGEVGLRLRRPNPYQITWKRGNLQCGSQVACDK